MRLLEKRLLIYQQLTQLEKFGLHVLIINNENIQIFGLTLTVREIWLFLIREGEIKCVFLLGNGQNIN
jgi:hypothetical protein